MSQKDPNLRPTGDAAVASTWPEPACPKCGLVLAPDAKVCPNDGTKIGEDNLQAVPGYQFLRLLGSGGMGNVYEAEHSVLKKKVAIKTLKSHLIETSAFVRFQKEAKAASSLKHPNIVSVYDCGISKNGEPYMIMDLVIGETVADLIKRDGALSIEESTNILREICAGVSCAHEKGILHRDLKPSNVILEQAPHGKVARVLDFGIAKILEHEGGGATMTNTGEVLGTPQYMSPEQANGLKIDQRSDIYAIGCIFYEMLTGLPPITGKSAMDTLFKQINEVPPPLSQTAMRKFPEALEALVARALAKDPAARFQTVRSLMEALDNSSVKRASLEGAQGSVRSTGKSVVLPVVASVACLAIAGAGFAFWSSFHSAGSDRRSAITPDPSAKVLPDSAPNSSKLSTAPKDSKPVKAALQKDSLTSGYADPAVTNGLFARYLGNHAQSTILSVGKLGDATDFTDISDDGLIPVGRCKQVRTLRLGDCQRLTANGLQHLLGLPNLTNLDIPDTSLGDDALAVVAKMPLHDLNLARTKTTDEGLKALSACSSLTGLNLKGTSVTVDGMKQVAKLRHLNGLVLDSCKGIEDKAVAALIPLKLTVLRLNGTSVTDKVAQSILKMPDLTALALSSTNVGKECLDQLSKKKNLKRLDIADCPGLSAEDVASFRRALPHCVLDVGKMDD